MSETIDSSKQTKEWRTKQTWYINGKHNECEIYQIKILEEILEDKIEKTDERINAETCEILSMSNPLKGNDGFEWSENFDGTTLIGKHKFYFNMKFVCGSGGAQTRTLRETYHFIKNQINLLILRKTNIYFINILDGDCCHKYISKYVYLLNNYNSKISKHIFIGDMKQFKKWFHSFSSK